MGDAAGDVRLDVNGEEVIAGSVEEVGKYAVLNFPCTLRKGGNLVRVWNDSLVLPAIDKLTLRKI